MNFDDALIEEYIDYFPESLQELIRLIGFSQTRQLLSHYGGAKRYIPKRGAQKGRRWDAISDEAFSKLCALYCGETLELPKLDSLLRIQRDLNIVEQSRSGASRAELVAQFGLTNRQIGNIRRRYRMGCHSPSH
ncbi:Mor transcription activator family protein [Gallaecimonas pentaromativorans]|uniref:Mor transcription activator family protein n=1 Tax=Gallaecimonas pentaromativorans TaxID=584787 RepID=A0A3N1PMJ1_9GAMM|nr:Mor transcription activator family protein [Gallaecimonas pentaromativorans]MED5524163.1 Mor transcription activator family protein [Pseudomonadota bacterium]ROQ29925.1 Mor transcription activator family protein [Gallaecimonas pentaromativorans]